MWWQVAKKKARREKKAHKKQRLASRYSVSVSQCCVSVSQCCVPNETSKHNVSRQMHRLSAFAMLPHNHLHATCTAHLVEDLNKVQCASKDACMHVVSFARV